MLFMPPTTCKLFQTSASRIPETKLCWAWHYGLVRWCQGLQTDIGQTVGARGREVEGLELIICCRTAFLFGFSPYYPVENCWLCKVERVFVVVRGWWSGRSWAHVNRGLSLSQACTRSQPSCWAPGLASTTPCPTGRPCCTWPCSGRTARARSFSWSTRRT